MGTRGPNSGAEEAPARRSDLLGRSMWVEAVRDEGGDPLLRSSAAAAADICCGFKGVPTSGSKVAGIGANPGNWRT